MSANRTHRQKAEELYADDPAVSPYWLSAIMAEADELDAAAARNDELLEEWEDRAEQEEGEPA